MSGWGPKKVKEFKTQFSSFLSNLKIDSKETGGRSDFNLYNAQRRFLSGIFSGLEEDVHSFTILKSRQLGICLDPDTLVLTAELRWVRIVDMRLGQEVVAVDEYPPGGRGRARQMRTATVQGVVEVYRKAYRLTFDDGRSVICTGAHPWLSRKVNTDATWRSIEGTKTNYKKLKIGTRVRWITKPWGGSTVEDGWFGGMLDGEGSISNGNRAGASVNVSQLRGPVWDRLVQYGVERGYNCVVENDETLRKTKYGNSPVPKLCFNRMNEVFRLIGQTRPTRFIGKRWWEGRELPGKRIGGIGWATIVDIEPLGDRTMVDLQTSTGTYIAEGFVSHNTTASLALDLFWVGSHEGLQGAVVFDTDGNKEKARTLIERYMESLPPDFGFPAAKRHYRGGLVLENGSTLDYLVAGIKKSRGSGGLGRSRALNFMHATECSSWADEEGLASLKESLAADFENRLYIWESTARGFNVFYDMWEDAKADDLSQRAIFIGWWAKEVQSYAEGTPLFERYGAALPVPEEEEKIKLVWDKYGHRVTQEQLAWIRHKENPRVDENRIEVDQVKSDMMSQEQPWTEEEAFLTSGSTFFPGERLTEATKTAIHFPYKGYSYLMGEDFLATVVDPVRVARRARLKIWEEPDPMGVYTIGADPAFGSSDTGDRYVIQVLRCYADGLDQVAEFADTVLTTYQFAWIIAHLCGYYANARLLMEINGPGMAVWNEFRVLMHQMRAGELRDVAEDMGVANIFKHVKQYLWTKGDAIAQTPTQFHWVTNTKRKVEVLEQLRNGFHLGQIKVRSMETLEEMRHIVRDGDSIHGEGKTKDDRVIALALAVRAWEDGERKRLITAKRTREYENRRESFTAVDFQNMLHGRILEDYFARQKRDRLATMRRLKYGTRWSW